MIISTIDNALKLQSSSRASHTPLVYSAASTMSASPTWLATAIGFGGGFLAHYLMQQYERDHHRSSSSSSSSSNIGINRLIGGGGDASSSSSSGGGLELPLPLRDTRFNPPLEMDSLNTKQSIDDVDFANKRVLMRVDYNVKIKGGKVVDATRITSTIPTLLYILAGGKKNASSSSSSSATSAAVDPSNQCRCIVLITHLGRPAGNIAVAEYTVEPLIAVLREHLPGVAVRFLPDCVGAEIEAATKECAPNTVFLCENLRFHPEETGIRLRSKADGTREQIRSTWAEKAAFRAGLSRLGDVFVFEAFGAAHRPHASIVGIDLPQRVAGLLMQREMSYYGRVLSSPARPFLAIVGGAKVSDKILVLENMLNLVDEMIIGGGMAYTFLRIINNVAIGDSLFDQEGAGLVHRIVEKARVRGIKLHLPIDHIIGDKFSSDARIGVTDNDRGIPAKWIGLDAGPKTRSVNSEVIARAATVLWNGPLGVYEMGPFGGGTISAFWDLVSATKRGAVTIIGGGDTGSASKFFYVGNKAVADSVSHVSTGGGSSLVLMEGKMLPGVGALSEVGNNERPKPMLESEEVIDEEEE